jgi:histidyl-tRNA synthetase
LGVERVLELLKEQGALSAQWVPDVYAIVPDALALPQVSASLQTLRRLGVSAQMHAPSGAAEGMGSMKSQFKKADASGAHFALVFGADELAQGQVTVKSLRDGQGAQRTEELAQISRWGLTLQSKT